ncbi:MAG: M1 family peptidase [Gemmatimonadetes bacterium]|nr:M1 family peptidase [Gemmatimonadota bacterium]
MLALTRLVAGAALLAGAATAVPIRPLADRDGTSPVPTRPMASRVAHASTRRDTYPRQSVDVEHYRFAITLSDTTDRIVAEATVRMRLLTAGLTRVELDLIEATPARQGRGMRVSGVVLATPPRGGRAVAEPPPATPLAFTHANDRLAITLPAPSTSGQVVEVTVRYAGIPADGLLITANQHGDRTFFSDDWPDKARNWLPLIDHVADKATMEMDVVAPARYQVISNGRRMEQTDLLDGTRRTVWRESVPISPWLYALGVARFATQHVDDYHGVPIETWVFAQDREAGFHDFAIPSRDALAFYSERIGPYQYEKLANVQSNSVAGGMEAASAIFYSAGSVSGTRPVRWRNVVIHEIAHQWFGNAVTEADWNDVWLSEGFATYFTLLFIEHAYGRDAFADGLRASRAAILDLDAKSLPNYRVVHENLADMAKVTTRLTYEKGAWTLHMLRQRLGDDAFWRGIRDYYARHVNATATTADFRLAMERASGQDLKPFFDQWLHRGGVPRLEGTWQYDAKAKQVVLELRQVQATEPFTIPIDVQVIMPATRVAPTRIELTGRSQRFTIPALEGPMSVDLDPELRVLMDAKLTRR